MGKKKKYKGNGQMTTKRKRGELTREDVYHKPILAQLYDKMNPGDYTIRQDFYHSLFIFSFLVIVVACLVTMNLASGFRHDYDRSAKLIIPSTTFVASQESTVRNTLSDYGFVDMELDENGNLVAYGNPDIVQQYKDSFYEKNVADLDKKITSETGIGYDSVESIEVTDDYKTMTIKTYRNVTENEAALQLFLSNDDIKKAIQSYSDWCLMRNEGGTPLTIKFVNVLDTTDGSGGTQYYETSEPTASKILAEYEKNAADEQENDEQQDRDSSTSNSE